MSTWTHVAGTIVSDFPILIEIEEYVNEVKNIVDMNQPVGSEGGMNITINNVGTIINFNGSLRDFTEDDIEHKLIPWFNSILDFYGHEVRNAIMTATASNCHTHIVERRMYCDRDMCEEMDMKNNIMWFPDPGIVIHTNRTVITKKESNNDGEAGK